MQQPLVDWECWAVLASILFAVGLVALVADTAESVWRWYKSKKGA